MERNVTPSKRTHAAIINHAAELRIEVKSESLISTAFQAFFYVLKSHIRIFEAGAIFRKGT